MKADTMNEKTIELPPFSELARLTQWLDAKYARHKEIEDADASKLLHTLWRAAHRSRAASEPGEVARLVEEARRNADAARHDLLMAIYERHDVAATFFAFDRLAVGKDRDAARNALCEYDRALLMKIDNLMALSALAATATSPASEAQKAVAGHQQRVNDAARTALQYAETLIGYEPTGHNIRRSTMLKAAIITLRDLATPTASMADAAEPIDMVLHCPACGLQHIDAPEVCACGVNEHGNCNCSVHKLWHNPPHRSHLCHGCGRVWRPADVPTNGVAEVKTRGKADSATPGPRGENAGGVVEALSDEVTWQLWREANASSCVVMSPMVPFQNFADRVARACATAWGLRIAEKGDAS